MTFPKPTPPGAAAAESPFQSPNPRTAVAATSTTLTWITTCGIFTSSVPSTFTTSRSEEHTSELQSRFDLVCRLLLEKKKTQKYLTLYLTSLLLHVIFDARFLLRQ